MSARYYVAPAILAIGLAVSGVATSAEPPRLSTTGDLVRYCDPAGSAMAMREGQDFCNGFIVGTGLLYLELVRAGTIQPWVCAPEPPPTLDEARAAFVAWAKANPQNLGDKPIDGFWRAMAAKYPCSK